MRLLVGNGLLTSNGEFWLRQRRIAQPAFAKKRIDTFAEAMVRCTEEMLDRWDTNTGGEALNLAEEMMRLTLRVVGLTLLDADLENEARDVGDALTVTLERIDSLIVDFLPFAEHWPTKTNRAFRKGVATIDGVVNAVIEKRRRSTEGADDLLTMLMEAEDQDTGERMNDAQLLDEVKTLFLAGYETTANALSWTLFLLGRNPDVLREVTDEVRRVLGERPPALADLASLPLVSAVISESLRLYPPAWVVGRHVEEDVVLGGFVVPRGTFVFVSPYATHRHPAFWDEPLRFDPSRFLGDKEPPRSAYIPFIEGPRQCIGKGFALMEAKLILASVLRRIDFEFEHLDDVTPAPGITLRPAPGVYAKINARSGRS